MIDTPPTPPSPRARRPILDANTSPTSPQLGRIARPPNVPGIYEDEEPNLSSSEENQKQTTPPPRKKSKSKPRLSASKLPLPARGPSPVPSIPQPPVSHKPETPIIIKSPKLKPSRRQSGLLTIDTEALSIPRSGSPAFGSPIRLEALESESDKDDKDGMVEALVRSKEKKRSREDNSEIAIKFKQNDVSAPRTALQPIDNSHLSSSPAPANPSETDGTTGGRERRTRRSVNYAEPKLNTYVPIFISCSFGLYILEIYRKMRKPDPAGSSDPSRPKKRSSAAAVMSTTTDKSPDVMDTGNEADADTEARSSLEVAPAPTPPLLGFPLRGANGDYINPEFFPLPASRPGSAAAMYSPGPPTRTTDSTTSSSSTNTTNTAATTASSSSSSSQDAKRKRSRPQIVLGDSDSDGAEADAEYAGGSSGSGSGSSNWVNVEGRRKALPKRNAAVVAVTVIEDIRRHSLAY